MEISDKVIVLAMKEALAQKIHYVLSVYNDQKETYAVSFHPQPSLAGAYAFQHYGASGIKSLNKGKSKIWRIRSDASKPDGISMERVCVSISLT